MAVITPDQFDAPSSGGGSRQITEADFDKPEAVATGNYAPPLRTPTIGGELEGGLKQIGKSFSSLGKPSESLIDTPAAQLGLGAIRTAASLYAPVDNVAAKVGAGSQDYFLSKFPNSPNLSALLATVADLGTNVGLTYGTGLLAKGARTAAARFLPYTAEKVAATETAAAAKEASLAREAARKTQVANAVRDQEAQRLNNLRDSLTSPVTQGEADLRAGTQGARTAEELGQEFKTQTYPTKQAASSAKFSDAYQSLVDEGRGIDTKGEIIKQQAEDTLAEKGLAGTPGASKAEKSASMLKDKLTPEQQGAAALENQLPPGYKISDLSPDHQKKLIEQFGSNVEKTTNLGDLILERQRLKGAGRAAFQGGNGNLGRQFGDLEKSVMQQIQDANPELAGKLGALDKQYATEHVPFFGSKSTTRAAADRSAETVLDKFIPQNTAPNRVEQATRAFQLADNPEEIKKSFLSQGVSAASNHKSSFGEGFVNWWDKYADPKTDDKVLRTWLGNDYGNLKDTVQQFRNVKPKSVDKAIDNAIAGLDKTAAERGKFAIQNRDAATKQIRSDVEKQVKELTGEKMDPKRVRNYGMFLMIEGAVSSVIGSPTGALRGVAGGLMVTTPKLIAKIINIPGGSQLIRRGMRAYPGTMQAAATARQLQTLLSSLRGKEDESQQ